MPTLPWTAFRETDPDREYVVMASRLPLARYRHVPSFLRATLAIRGQLAHADGLVGYSLDAQLVRKTFWTLSVWDSPAALAAFARADPHADRVRSVRPRMRPTAFATWTMRGAELPVTWTHARARLADQAPSA